MFSQASVILSLNGGRWTSLPPPGQGTTYPPPQEGKVIGLPTSAAPSPNIRALCAYGRHASYWNAFLLQIFVWLYLRILIITDICLVKLTDINHYGYLPVEATGPLSGNYF